MLNTEIVPISHDRSVVLPDRESILWQVQEVNYPFAENAYDAIDYLIYQINDLITNPRASDADRWLFQPKDDCSPSVHFMFFPNKQTIRGIIYDMTFMVKALTASPGIVSIPLGHTSEVIYHKYYTAKYLDSKKVPKLPQTLIEGNLSLTDSGYSLGSVFKNGWDCKHQYKVAHIVPNYPTEAYDDISSISRYSIGYRHDEILRLIEKWYISADDVPKLFVI